MQKREKTVLCGGQKIYGQQYLPEGDGRYPLVIFSHGFNGSGDDFEDYARELTEQGIGAYSFDFRGGAVGSRSEGKTGDMTVGTQQEDLRAVLDAAAEWRETDPEAIFLFGASQGGLVSALTAEDRQTRVRGLMLLFPAFCIEDDWSRRFPSAADIPVTQELWDVKLGQGYFFYMRGLDTFSRIGHYGKPVLIMHGDQDEVVPLSYARRAAGLYPRARLEVFEGEGHGFGEEGNRRAVRMTAEFLRECLRPAADYPQLDPKKNRTRTGGRGFGIGSGEVHTLPEQIDPRFPEKNARLGFVPLFVTDEAGKERELLAYIPETEKSAWNMVLVFVPGGKEPEAFFREGGWREILERHCMTGFFLAAPEGWRRQEPGFELETAVRALAVMRSNRYFQSNAPGIYCMGFEDGAAAAALFAVTHVSVLAGWAAWGDTQLDEALLASLGDGPSDCDAALRRGEISLPTFLIGGESNVLSYFKRACRVKDEGLCNAHGKVFRMQPGPGESWRNDGCCCEVWEGDEERARRQGLAETAEAMTAFVEKFKRWGGEGNGHIRPTLYPSRERMRKTEQIIDGRIRHWWTFVPDAYTRGRKEKYPLVIAIHGFTCHGEFFANNSGWNMVGQERDAFVVYPSAYPYQTTDHGRDGRFVPTPEWNAGGMPGGVRKDGPDELHYFRCLLEDIQKNYPIDPERIYVTGHSNGAMMTQRLMRMMPEVFAGFAPVGAMEDNWGTMEPEPEDGILRNVWYVIGEYDGAGCVLEEGNGNVRTIRKLCEHNRIVYENRRYYECGIYMHSLFRDASGVPLVRFTGVKNWPHTYSPELAFMLYDEFFARFVRRKDGTLEYLA